MKHIRNILLLITIIFAFVMQTSVYKGYKQDKPIYTVEEDK